MVKSKEGRVAVFTKESMDRFRAENRLKEYGPEMLAALQQYVRAYDLSVCRSDHLNAADIAARDVLAKAVGQTVAH